MKMTTYYQIDEEIKLLDFELDMKPSIQERNDVLRNHVHDPVQFEIDKANLQKAARNTMARKNIHIWITNHVLEELKRKAARTGMPYQTYINYILHQFVNGELVNK